MPSLEIACFDVESARRAIDANANRIELCSGLVDGGVTPEQRTLEETQDYLRRRRIASGVSPPVHIMVRPRGGDFAYTTAEFEKMKATIIRFKTTVDGFVFGILNSDYQVDEARNTELVALAYPLSCTFHRAFDEVRDLQEALEAIVRCGFRTLLTSGGKATAEAGTQALKDLNEQAHGRIVLMPGGGIRSSNIDTMVRNTGATWYHSSAIVDSTNLASEAEITQLRKTMNTFDL